MIQPDSRLQTEATPDTRPTKIYRIKVRQRVEMTFRVRAVSRTDAEDKAVHEFSKSEIFMAVNTGKPITLAGVARPDPPLLQCQKDFRSCEAVGTAEDRDQTSKPDIS